MSELYSLYEINKEVSEKIINKKLINIELNFKDFKSIEQINEKTRKINIASWGLLNGKLNIELKNIIMKDKTRYLNIGSPRNLW